MSVESGAGQLSTSASPAADNGLTSFYTVQDRADRERLASGGEPWPVGLIRACIGPGFYCWPTRAEGETYLARMRRVGAVDVRLLRYDVPSDVLAGLRVLDLTNGTDDEGEAWAEVHSEYGTRSPIVPHHYDVVFHRNLNVGRECYFSPAAFGRLTLAETVEQPPVPRE